MQMYRRDLRDKMTAIVESILWAISKIAVIWMFLE